MMASTREGLLCLCANFRRTARILTQRYDDALRVLGLTITQFTILQALSLTKLIAQGALGEILGMDSTTLTRTLAVMARKGWINKQQGTDRRQRELSLSRIGEAEFNRAVPHWQKVQDEMR